MLLGARQFFERRGAPTPSVPTARDYVQDGLIAMWDGIENAGWGTHDANATVWADLVGTRTISIPSGYSWSDNHIETSAGNFAQMSAGFDSFISMECVFRPYVTGCSILYLSESSLSTHGWRTADERGLAYRANGQLNFTGAGKYIAGPSVNTDCDVGVQFPSGEAAGGVEPIAAWIDGYTASLSTSGGMYGLGSTRGFGISPFVAYAFKGRIYNLRLYSRALTAAEIAANYAIDKARFNLP